MGFQQGLSGLNASSKNLDVIGHNIANSGTVGFKASRTEFADMVASAIGTSGGTNAGIGVQVGAVAQQFTQGNITVTGNNLDVAINGNGFFILQPSNGSPHTYTRAGNFKLDDLGNLVTNSGEKLMGYPAGSTTLAPIVFPTGAYIAPQKTGSVSAEFNLDARATVGTMYGTSIQVFDDLGKPITVDFEFTNTGANAWSATAAVAGGAPITLPPLSFDPSSGSITAGATGTLNIPSPPASTAFSTSVDFSRATQYGAKFAVTDLTQTGYTAGSLTGINIGDDGRIMARYSNGVTRSEGSLALANFRNTQGLAPIGNNNWAATIESGPAVPGQPGSGNLGALRSGALEDSNVDLTAELVNMMTAQRAYQANAQTIKTQDQIMSTLVNLR